MVSCEFRLFQPLIRDRVGVGVRSDVLGHRTQKAEAGGLRAPY